MRLQETNGVRAFTAVKGADFRHAALAPAASSVDLPRSAAPARPAKARADSAYVRFGFKRLLDVVVATTVLIAILPLLPLIVLALVIQDGPSVIFHQPRMGMNGSRFQCLKFRSMARDAEQRLKLLLQSCSASREEWRSAQKLRSDPRIHPVGHLLRKSSLDEIPQLINVLRGEMSIVGPRPMLPDQVPLYGDLVDAYSSVRPGITGLWQVSGRNRLTFDQRVTLDARYSENVTFLGDVRILAKTVRVVLLGDGSC